MSWLNWSLNLHIRLRTISFLISHISMFNECLIHLCDCACLNVLHILNYMLIKHKKSFECFNFFWKAFFFFFEKFKKFQKLCNSVLVTLPCWLSQSWAYSKALGNSLADQGPSHEKGLEIFSKIWVFSIFATQFGDWFASGNSSREFYSESFAALLVTYSWVDLPITKNT